MRIWSTTLRTLWRSALVLGVTSLMAMGWLLSVPLTNAALDVPQILNYQARLTDDSRITVSDASLAMQFTLYDAITSGNCIYVAGGTCGTPITVSVATVDGVFTVPLGDGTLTNTFTDTIFDDNAGLFLEVEIAGETLTPRRQLTSAAYAMQAGDSDLLDSLDSDNNGCTSGCIVAANSNGNVVVTGDPQSALAAGAAFYINPASPASDEAIFGIANGGTAVFTLDEDGDITRIGSSTITDTVDQTSFTLTNNAATSNDVMVISATGLTSGDALQITTGVGDSAINVAVGDVLFQDKLTVTGLVLFDGTSSTPDTATGDGDVFIDDALEVDGLIDGDGTGENTFAGSITAGSGSASVSFGGVDHNYAIGADSTSYSGSPSSNEIYSGLLGFAQSSLTPSSSGVVTTGTFSQSIDSSSGNTSTATANEIFGVYSQGRSDLASSSDVTAKLIGLYGWALASGIGDVTEMIGVWGEAIPDPVCTGDCDITNAFGGKFEGSDGAGGTSDFTNLYGMSALASRTGSGTATNVTGGIFEAVGATTNTIGVDVVADHTASSSLTALTGITGEIEHSGSGTVTTMNGIVASIDITSSGTVTNGYGADILAANTSGTITTSLTGTRSRVTHASGALATGSGLLASIAVSGSATGTTLSGATISATSTSSGTLTTLYGALVSASNTAGTTTTIFGVDAMAGSGVGGTTIDSVAINGNSINSGTTTRAHGGYFMASGATTNYAVYTEAGVVHIDDVGSSSGSIGVPDIATGSGELYVNNDAEVDGVFRADGDVDLGDATGDTITVTGRFDSNLVPSANDTYDFGTDALRWKDAYIGAESIHLGTAVGDELLLSYKTSDNDLEFTIGAAGTIDFEITDDGHVGLSNTSATDNDTLRFIDTYDSISSGHTTRNGVSSTMTFSNNTVTSGVHRYNGYLNSITADDIDNDTTVTGFNTSITLTNTAPVSLDSETLVGISSGINVSDASSRYDRAVLFSGATKHDGSGTSNGWNGSLNTLEVIAGTVANAKAFSGTITANGGSITTAQGMDITIVDTGAGSITDGIGLNIDVSTASSDNLAIYVANGGVHIDNGVFSGSTSTPATFSGIGGDGTLFVKSGIELHNGALCVGGSTTCASASASAAGQIYADGSINANDFDLAEMFESGDYLIAGEIVTIDHNSNETVRRADPGDTIIGAVSTDPGLVLGWGGDNQYPIALAGRVPVKVSDENGSIKIGDRITMGSSPGIGMRATDQGYILGIAMQPSNGGTNDVITVFLQQQYWNGNPTDVTSVTQQTPSPVVRTNTVLVVESNDISNIASLKGANWSVDSEGIFTTEGSYDLKTKGHQNKNVVTHAVTALDNYITMAGTTIMDGKLAKIEFERINPEFNDVIEAGTPIFVTATMSNGSGNVYITDKSMNGFTLHREDGSGTEVDWVVTAFRKGYAPEEEDEEDVEEEEIVEEELDPVDGEIVDDEIDDETDPDPAEAEDPVDEPEVIQEEEAVDEAVEEEIEEASDPADDVIEEVAVEEPIVPEVIEDELEVELEVETEVETEEAPTAEEVITEAEVAEEAVE